MGEINETQTKNLINAIAEDVKKTLLLEMATFGRLSDGKRQYKIAIHGPATNDRQMPHIHIYLNNDIFPYSQFNFEISLVDIVCFDKITLIAQTDRENNIKRTNKEDCSWEGYRDLLKEFKKFLSQKPMKKVYKNAAINNLQVAIMEWDNENNDNMEDDESLMKKSIESKGFIILPKYLRYFQY